MLETMPIHSSPAPQQGILEPMKSTPSQINTLNRLSVVMPVYNEAFTLREIVRRVKLVPLPIELIIVDDHSTDGSSDILRRMESEGNTTTDPPPSAPIIKFVFQDKNQGKGACIRRGINEATGEVLIIQDADLEYNPEDYPKLIEPILSGEADVVYGSRFRGEKRSVLLFWHTVGNKFLTMFSNIFTNLNLSDMETCYKVFKTEIIKSIPIRSQRFGFEPEITAKVAKLRCNIYEVPISYRGRGYSEGKKINWKDGISAIFTILRFWLFDDLYEETAGLRTLRIMEGAGKYNRWLFDQSNGLVHLHMKIVGVRIQMGKHLPPFVTPRPFMGVISAHTDDIFQIKQT